MRSTRRKFATTRAKSSSTCGKNPSIDCWMPGADRLCQGKNFERTAWRGLPTSNASRLLGRLETDEARASRCLEQKSIPREDIPMLSCGGSEYCPGRNGNTGGKKFSASKSVAFKSPVLSRNAIALVQRRSQTDSAWDLRLPCIQAPTYCSSKSEYRFEAWAAFRIRDGRVEPAW